MFLEIINDQRKPIGQGIQPFTKAGTHQIIPLI